MAGPGVTSGRVVKTAARLMDVLLMLLDYARLPIRANLDGRVHARGRKWRDRRRRVRGIVVFTIEVGVGTPVHMTHGALQVHRGARKFIEAPEPELYDVQKDASETTNRVTNERVRAYHLRQSVASKLHTWIDRLQLEPGDAFPEKSFREGMRPWPLRTSMSALRCTRAAALQKSPYAANRMRNVASG